MGPQEVKSFKLTDKWAYFYPDYDFSLRIAGVKWQHAMKNQALFMNIIVCRHNIIVYRLRQIPLQIVQAGSWIAVVCVA